MTHPEVSFDVNPTSRQLLENLAALGSVQQLVRAGARLHQAGCNGCIGMGQAPATGRISLRTVPRNFPGRSGTQEDQVYLCSPETAAASALIGEITDPRDLVRLMDMPYPRFRAPEREIINTRMMTAPPADGRRYGLEKGPNIKALPEFPLLADTFRAPVLIKLGDDISTDEILRAGAEVLPYRSNIPEIAKWTYYMNDDGFYEKALQARDSHGGHIAVAGANYAQGSSREHAAIAPRFLGQIAVLAKGYGRIGWQNLINFGILPLEFERAADYDDVAAGDLLSCRDLRRRLAEGLGLMVRNESRRREYAVIHRMSERQIQVVLAGGVIRYFRERTRAAEEAEAVVEGRGTS
jgi:aconitate hydratase